MNIPAIIVCVIGVLAASFEVFNKNYSAAHWALCAAVWAGMSIYDN